MLAAYPGPERVPERPLLWAEAASQYERDSQHQYRHEDSRDTERHWSRHGHYVTCRAAVVLNNGSAAHGTYIAHGGFGVIYFLRGISGGSDYFN